VSVSFLEAILPPGGPYLVAGIVAGGGVRTKIVDSPEAILAAGTTVAESGRDAYFNLSKLHAGSTHRQAADADSLRCFFADVDCGPGKPYIDKAAGATALREFTDKTGLSAPYIVDSGNGLHVYWPIVEVMARDVWRPLALAFKKLCLTSGFQIDPVATADCVRLLRIPGTFNCKKDPKLPVILFAEGVPTPLSEFAKLLPQPDALDGVDLSSVREAGGDSFTKSLARGDYPATSFARIAKKSLTGHGCAQIAKALKEAETLEEPLWRAALSIAWRCEDGSTAIHKMSEGHPGYSPEKTIAKARDTAGPHTCQWYKDNFPTDCEKCALRITSPIVLGRKVEAAPETDGVYVVEQQLDPDNIEGRAPQFVQINIPTYPWPYFRGKDGGVFRKVKDKDGNVEEVVVYENDLYLTSRFYDTDEAGGGEGELVGVNVHTPHDGIRRFTAPVSVLLVKEKMRDLLLKHGVACLTKEMENIMAYLASSIRQLQQAFAADRTRHQMGWTPDLTGFVVGELEYTATGTRLAPAGSTIRALAPKLQPMGSLDEWKKVANFYNHPGMEGHALGLLLGFGAPLLRLIGGMEVRGATINFMSNRSGTGKTTLQMAINSIYGHPADLLLKKEDTLNSKMQVMGMMNNIAVTMDEVTNMKDEEVSEFVYSVPHGKGKNRMEAQTNRLRVNTTSWNTMAFTSSNSSLYDKLIRNKNTPEGELRRLIEINIDRGSAVSKAESDEVFSLLAENYGVAGPLFIQFVLQNMEQVKQALLKARQKLDRDLGNDQSDRFYSNVMACYVVAERICRHLGLLTFDTKAIYAYAISLFTGIRREVLAPVSDTSMVAQETLTTYINDNLSNTLIINPTIPGQLPSAPIQLPRGPLRLRYEPVNHSLWIPATALRDFFVSRQVDFKQAVKSLAAAGVLRDGGATTTKRISAGAMGSYDATGVRAYCVDGQAVGLAPEVFVSGTGGTSESDT